MQYTNTTTSQPNAEVLTLRKIVLLDKWSSGSADGNNEWSSFNTHKGSKAKVATVFLAIVGQQGLPCNWSSATFLNNQEEYL
jgi:hypothetical protein